MARAPISSRRSSARSATARRSATTSRFPRRARRRRCRSRRRRSRRCRSQPRLWWPNGYGEPTLHAVTVGVKVGRLLSDERTLNIGLRRIDHARDIGMGKQLSITVNGLPILVMGGNRRSAEAHSARAAVPPGAASSRREPQPDPQLERAEHERRFLRRMRPLRDPRLAGFLLLDRRRRVSCGQRAARSRRHPRRDRTPPSSTVDPALVRRRRCAAAGTRQGATRSSPSWTRSACASRVRPAIRAPAR